MNLYLVNNHFFRSRKLGIRSTAEGSSDSNTNTEFAAASQPIPYCSSPGCQPFCRLPSSNYGAPKPPKLVLSKFFDVFLSQNEPDKSTANKQ